MELTAGNVPGRVSLRAQARRNHADERHASPPFG
jgi:hypothetical protein